jgi:hypothetical protein
MTTVVGAFPSELTAAIIGAVAGIAGAAVGSFVTARANRESENRRLAHERELRNEEDRRLQIQQRAVARAAARLLQRDFLTASIAVKTTLEMQATTGVASELEAQDFVSSIDADDRRLIAGLLDSTQWIRVNRGENTLRRLNVRVSKQDVAGRPNQSMLERSVEVLDNAYGALKALARDEDLASFDERLAESASE